MTVHTAMLAKSTESLDERRSIPTGERPANDTRRGLPPAEAGASLPGTERAHSGKYLGPATVIAPAGSAAAGDRKDFVEVQLPRGEVSTARLALAGPYEPAAGDEVLVIAEEMDAPRDSITPVCRAAADPRAAGTAPHDACPLYVIGLLRGSGTTRLRVRGDLSIEAPEGEIRLTAGRAVRAVAPEMVLRAGRIEIFCSQLIQHARNFYGWFSGLFQVRARRVRALGSESCLIKTGRAYLRAEGDVRIDGKSINLG